MARANGGNCSIRAATRRRHAVAVRLVVQNPPLAAGRGPALAASRADRRWWAVDSPDSSGECSANLGDEPSRMVEVVPADTDDVPSLRFEVTLPLALAGE